MAEGKSERLLSLDVLRGVAVLLMMLSGVVPYSADMPRWMFHAQTPPPSFKFDPTLPGVTWVDLVFPMFLFAMGAAIPLSLGKRTGESPWKAAGGLLWRGALLGAFAFYSQHFRPRSIEPSPSPSVWWLSLGMFFVAILIWGRYPKCWPAWARYGPQLAGWGLALAALLSLAWADGRGAGPSVTRSDPIILVLANMALFGGALWLATRRSSLVRLGVMAAVLLLFVGSTAPESASARIWGWSPVSWLTGWVYWKYLLVIVPGTLVGDFLLQIGAGDDESPPPAWAWPRWAPLALGCLGLVTAVIASYYSRLEWFAWSPMLVLAGVLVFRPGDRYERAVSQIVVWSLAWVALGALVEPFQGGIKKDPATISYLLTMSGLSGLVLAACMSLERMRVALPVGRFLAASGQNALLAYAAITNLVAPIWFVTPLGGWVAERTPGPLLGTLRGGLQTLLLALLVWLFTRLKIAMRA